MQKIESIKIGLKEEIEKYKLKKTFFKDYSLSMKEISAWLKEKEKK